MPRCAETTGSYWEAVRKTAAWERFLLSTAAITNARQRSRLIQKETSLKIFQGTMIQKAQPVQLPVA